MNETEFKQRQPFLERFRREEAETRDAEEQPYLSLRPNMGQELTLDLQLRNGRCVGLPYAYLASLDYDADRIELLFSTHQVRIRGRNLQRLYRGLRKHSVEFIRESPTEFDDAGEEETFIAAIEVETL